VNNTKHNLQTAIAGKSQENHKYLLFAEKAKMIQCYLHVCTEVMRNG